MQATSSASRHQSQEPQSGSGPDSQGKGGGQDVSHDESQGRGDIRDRQLSLAAGVTGGPSGPLQQRPIPSGRGRGGFRGSSGAQSRGRGRGRGGHSAHPTERPHDSEPYPSTSQSCHSWGHRGPLRSTPTAAQAFRKGQKWRQGQQWGTD